MRWWSVVRRMAKRFFEKKSASQGKKHSKIGHLASIFSFASPLRYLTQQMRILTKSTAATRSTTLPKAGTANLCKRRDYNRIHPALPAGYPPPAKQISRINLEKLDLYQNLITVFTYNRF